VSSCSKIGIKYSITSSRRDACADRAVVRGRDVGTSRQLFTPPCDELVASLVRVTAWRQAVPTRSIVATPRIKQPARRVCVAVDRNRPWCRQQDDDLSRVEGHAGQGFQRLSLSLERIDAAAGTSPLKWALAGIPSH
jgi:hypothetical protein